MESVVDVLKAAGEPTRLRILSMLARCELTTTELCRILGQSQPRVSRHLKLLCSAGLLERHRQGAKAFFRPTSFGTPRVLFDSILEAIDPEDETLRRDLSRLATIRAERAAEAAAYFERIAADWDSVRDLHVSDDQVEKAMIDAVADVEVSSLLDVGTGTGRVLEVFADRIEHGIGIDLSKQMLDLARSRLDGLGLRHCSVRQSNIYDLDLESGSQDVAVFHHVLHFLDDPATAISEVGRTIRPRGRLLIVDFAPHAIEELRTDHAHHWLGFGDGEVERWCIDAGFVDVSVSHLPPQGRDDGLTVTLWIATQHSEAPAIYQLEAAS